MLLLQLHIDDFQYHIIRMVFFHLVAHCCQKNAYKHEEYDYLV